MSSINEAKEFLCDNYDGEITDWVLKGKEKDIHCIKSIFENKNTNQQVELINFEGDSSFYRSGFPSFPNNNMQID